MSFEIGELVKIAKSKNVVTTNFLIATDSSLVAIDDIVSAITLQRGPNFPSVLCLVVTVRTICLIQLHSDWIRHYA